MKIIILVTINLILIIGGLLYLVTEQRASNKALKGCRFALVQCVLQQTALIKIYDGKIKDEKLNAVTVSTLVMNYRRILGMLESGFEEYKELCLEVGYASINTEDESKYQFSPEDLELVKKFRTVARKYMDYANSTLPSLKYFK